MDNFIAASIAAIVKLSTAVLRTLYQKHTSRKPSWLITDLLSLDYIIDSQDVSTIVYMIY